MSERPTGTVTFLFTDIEGSTARWEVQTAEMQAALARHDDVLRTAAESHGGWLFKHTGDGVLAAFASPRAVVEAATEAQRGLELPVRMKLVVWTPRLPGVASMVRTGGKRSRSPAARSWNLPSIDDDVATLQGALGEAEFERLTAEGAGMETYEAFAFAREQLALARETLEAEA